MTDFSTIICQMLGPVVSLGLVLCESHAAVSEPLSYKTVSTLGLVRTDKRNIPFVGSCIGLPRSPRPLTCNISEALRKGLGRVNS